MVAHPSRCFLAHGGCLGAVKLGVLRAVLRCSEPTPGVERLPKLRRISQGSGDGERLVELDLGVVQFSLEGEDFATEPLCFDDVFTMVRRGGELEALIGVAQRFFRLAAHERELAKTMEQMLRVTP